MAMACTPCVEFKVSRLHHFCLLLLLLCFTFASSQEVVNEMSNGIEVDDYLNSLSTEALQKICLDRGFGLENEGKDFDRDDYLEAARRCVNLENEMNAILAENPELAAELEAEIERMKRAKDQLEIEREQILAEKTLLEQQLKEAGVDMEAAKTEATTFGQKTAGLSTSSVDPQSFEEVFKESIILLYDRVKQDLIFIRKLLRLILEPLQDGIKLVWRYTRPTLKQLWKQCVGKVKQIHNQLAEKDKPKDSKQDQGIEN